MKNKVVKKLNRIALISVAVAALTVCSSFTAFAANSTQAATVIYNGSGAAQTVVVENAANLNTFTNLMPGKTTDRQDIFVQNNSGQKMQVYFLATPATGAPDRVISQKLLDTLILKVTFKMDDNAAEQTLYEGPASGKTAEKDIVTKPISLGYVYENTTSGRISAVLTAPEKMDNQYQLSSAGITWSIQFEGQSPSSGGGGGGGNGGHGGGGGTIDPVSLPANESIDPDATPKTGPSSSPAPAETIPNEDVPLSNPPKTGESAVFVWILLIVALCAAIVFFITKRNIKSASNGK